MYMYENNICMYMYENNIYIYIYIHSIGGNSIYYWSLAIKI